MSYQSVCPFFFEERISAWEKDFWLTLLCELVPLHIRSLISVFVQREEILNV